MYLRKENLKKYSKTINLESKEILKRKKLIYLWHKIKNLYKK